MTKNNDLVEASALKIGVFVNLIMAIAGWVAFSVTGSEALLLDGNFSFISAITTVGAIMIIHKKHKKTDIFPFGRYFYESLFTLSKGLLILGVIIAAVFQNIIKIIAYVQGETLSKLETGPILIYMVLMVFLCFGLAFLYQYKNKKINQQSMILAVETKASKIDGYMTIAVGIALVLTTFVPEESGLSFLLYIGDAIIVILMAVLLIKTPFFVIKEGFIELGAGSVQNTGTKKEIEAIVYRLAPTNLEIANCYISKTGSSHLVLIYAKSKLNKIDIALIKEYRQKIRVEIADNYPNSEVEIVFR